MKSNVARCLLLFVLGCGTRPGNDVGPDASTGGADATTVDEADAAPGPRCGDGALDFDEVCDDGNTTSNDGCSGDCKTIEEGFACGDPGMTCVVTHTCGNGLLEPTEGCDDRNLTSNDGCSSACELEPGWTCGVPGIRCTAAQCGDGIVAGFEECDDGGAASPGCSATCELEPGYKCPTPGAACSTTTCGDGVTEGTEECDDANNDLGDGCTPLCTFEPVCMNGTCSARCGDGVLQAGEACDDGNLKVGDGCSATCTVELGFTCNPSTATEPTTIHVPIVLRDFRGHDLSGGHIDFENLNGGEAGMVKTTLDANGKPQRSATATKINSDASFAQWYRDTANVNITYAETLAFTRTGAATYVYDNQNFFPVDGRGFVGLGTEPARNNGHNFSFTSELRYWFTYKGGEFLEFRGDDDVWVFINGKLAVDIGGIHSADTKNITLNSSNATTFGLTVNGTYEVVVFQAERHTTASSYKLTLKGFNTAVSVCDDQCGDGVTSAWEVCDDGMNMGGYGSCTADCLGFGPRCGDAVVQSPQEECDDGTNVGGYGKCLPTCKLGPRCGDGIVQSPQEGCDDGNTLDGDTCSSTCQTIIL